MSLVNYFVVNCKKSVFGYNVYIVKWLIAILFVLFVLRGRKGWNKGGERVERVILEEKEKK